MKNKEKKQKPSKISKNDSNHSGHSIKPSISSQKPALQGTLAEKKRRQEKQRERRKLAQEILTVETKTEPEYLFQDATKKFASVPEKLEIHPTKQAPTLVEIENRLARQREQEKLKFFSVPMKMYEPDKENNPINLADVIFNEDDKKELHRYGSRIVLRPDGRVAAVEVEQEVMDELKLKRVSADFCQCFEKEYDVGEKLKNSPRARRIFMTKVLTVEALLRIPAIVLLYYQRKSTQLHDFIYQQNLLMLFVFMIIQGTRVAGIYFSKVGAYEPCRSLLTCLVMMGHGVLAALFTAVLEQYSLIYVDYKLYDNPNSLETLHAKRGTLTGQKVSYPYVVPLILINLAVINFFITLLLLICGKRVMDELKNGFIIVVIVVSFSLGVVANYVVITVGVPFISATPLGWDSTQIMFTVVVATKWTMWRFYMLQQVVKGKVLHVNEGSHQLVALAFSI